MAAVANGATTVEAARQAHMSARTAARRLTEPEVRLQLHAARLAVVEQVADRLSGAALDAVDTLRAIQADTAVAAGVRVQAAGGLIARVTALREASHVEARLAEVEAAIAQTLWATG